MFVTPTVFNPLYSTLHNDCSHIEDVQIIVYAHFTNNFF